MLCKQPGNIQTKTSRQLHSPSTSLRPLPLSVDIITEVLSSILLAISGRLLSDPNRCQAVSCQYLKAEHCSKCPLQSDKSILTTLLSFVLSIRQWRSLDRGGLCTTSPPALAPVTRVRTSHHPGHSGVVSAPLLLILPPICDISTISDAFIHSNHSGFLHSVPSFAETSQELTAAE